MRFLIPLLSPLFAWGAINQNNDIQLWVTEEVYQKITPSVSGAITNQWRFGDDVSKLFHFYLQGELFLKISDLITVGPAYRQAWRLTANQWRLTYQPLIDLFFEKRKGNLKVDLRNRFSYLLKEADLNTWQYRARARVMSAYQIGSKTFNWYLSNELFLETHSNFNEDRIQTGVILPILRHLNGDFYYMLRYLKTNDHWTHQHVFGAWFHLSF